VILKAQDNKWENLMFYIAGVYILLAIVIYFTFVAEPSEVGIEIANTREEEHEAERLDVNEPSLNGSRSEEEGERAAAV